MRLPSYLLRNRLGVFCLRVVLPRALHAGCPTLPREVRRSLGTRDGRHARACAVQFAACYQALLAQHEASCPGVSENLARLVDSIRTLMANTAARNAAPATRPATPAFRELRERPVLHELPAASPAADSEWLSEAIERYRDDMRLEERWRDEQTWYSAYAPTLRYFREIIAPDTPKRVARRDGREETMFDLPVGDLGEHHLRQFKAAMGKWPKGFGQGARGSHKQALSAKDALQMTHLPPQSAGNALKKFEIVKAFLRWAHKDGCIREGDRYARILPSKTRNGDSKRGYLPFTAAELRVLFESADYRENRFLTAAQYWIPLLGLYTGARINELAQLDIDDLITTDDGIRCFRIHDAPGSPDDQRDAASAPMNFARKTIKTASARRLVPIHPALLSIGLDRYVAWVAASGSKRLFPTLSYEEKSGYGRHPSRHFREYTQRLGLYVSRKKVFHSLRSTLNGELQKNGMEEERRCRLLGHATKSVNDRHYGGQTALHVIALELSRVDFGIAHPRYQEPAAPQKSKAT